MARGARCSSCSTPSPSRRACAAPSATSATGRHPAGDHHRRRARHERHRLLGGGEEEIEAVRPGLARIREAGALRLGSARTRQRAARSSGSDPNCLSVDLRERVADRARIRRPHQARDFLAVSQEHQRRPQLDAERARRVACRSRPAILKWRTLGCSASALARCGCARAAVAAPGLPNSTSAGPASASSSVRLGSTSAYVVFICDGQNACSTRDRRPSARRPRGRRGRRACGRSARPRRSCRQRRRSPAPSARCRRRARCG